MKYLSKYITTLANTIGVGQNCMIDKSWHGFVYKASSRQVGCRKFDLYKIDLETGPLYTEIHF